MTGPRFVVALDASPAARAALEAACALARARGATVECVFVEDEDALALAGHPVARVVARPGAAPSPVAAGAMERSMRAAGRRVGELAREAAARHGVRADSRTLRGRVAESVVGAAAGADLVLLGKGSRGAPAARATAPAVARGAAGPVLLLGEGEALGAPVALVDDPAEARAVVAAAALVAGGATVRVVALGDAAGAAREALEAAGVAGEVAGGADPEGALAGARTVVVGAGAWRRGVLDLVAPRLRVPVLVAR